MGGEEELVSAGCTGYIGLEPWRAAAAAGAKRVLDLEGAAGALTCWVWSYGLLWCEWNYHEEEEKEKVEIHVGLINLIDLFLYMALSYLTRESGGWFSLVVLVTGVNTFQEYNKRTNHKKNHEP